MSYAIINPDGTVFESHPTSKPAQPLPSFAPDSACGTAAALEVQVAATQPQTTKAV